MKNLIILIALVIIFKEIPSVFNIQENFIISDFNTLFLSNIYNFKVRKTNKIIKRKNSFRIIN